MSDLAEKVKRLRELAAKTVADAKWEYDWHQEGGVANCGIHFKSAVYGGTSMAVLRAPRYISEADWRALAEYVIAACNDGPAILDALERLERERDEHRARYAELEQKAQAQGVSDGNRITSLEAELAAITTERRTPGTVALEQLAIWPLLDAVSAGDGHSWVCHSTTDAGLKTVVWCQWCGVHQCEVPDWTDDPQCPAFEAMSHLKQRLCAQHPTPSQGTTP